MATFDPRRGPLVPATVGVGHRGMRPGAALWLALALTWLALGCAHRYALRTVPGRSGPATKADLTLTARFDQWRGRPGNLRGYLVPVWVELRNDSPRAVRLRLGDMGLMDEQGARHRALRVFDGKAQRGIAWALADGVGCGWRGQPWLSRIRGRGNGPSFVPTSFFAQPLSFWSPHRMSRSYVVDGPRPWSFPSQDVLRSGLAEGVLGPGGRVSGYLYFSSDVRRPGRLDLRWDAHDTDDTQLAVLEISVDVVVE